MRVQKIGRAMDDMTAGGFDPTCGVVERTGTASKEVNADGAAIRGGRVSGPDDERIAEGILRRRRKARESVIGLFLCGVGEALRQHGRERIRLPGILKTARNDLTGRPERIASGKWDRKGILGRRGLTACEAGHDERREEVQDSSRHGFYHIV